MKTAQQIINSIEFRMYQLQKELVDLGNPDTQGEFLYRADVKARLDELESLMRMINESVVY
jgi:hypothetical protein